MRKSNYDKFPVTMINGNIMQGWSDIRSVLEGKIKESRILAVDCYTGVYEDELVGELTKISAQIILVRDLYKPEEYVDTNDGALYDNRCTVWLCNKFVLD